MGVDSKNNQEERDKIIKVLCDMITKSTDKDDPKKVEIGHPGEDRALYDLKTGKNSINSDDTANFFKAIKIDLTSADEKKVALVQIQQKLAEALRENSLKLTVDKEDDLTSERGVAKLLNWTIADKEKGAVADDVTKLLGLLKVDAPASQNDSYKTLLNAYADQLAKSGFSDKQVMLKEGAKVDNSDKANAAKDYKGYTFDSLQSSRIS